MTVPGVHYVTRRVFHYQWRRTAASGCRVWAEDGGHHEEARGGRAEGGCADLRGARGLDLEIGMSLQHWG